jgi:hypothetical protein
MSSMSTLAVPRIDKDTAFEKDVREAVKELNKIQILNGQLLTGIALSTTTTRVPHKLGRPYVGFIVVDRTVDGRVYRDAAYMDQLSNVIPLLASTAMTVSLWIF